MGAYVFGYNSPISAAREVFKRSTDSTSLVVSSQTKVFSFGFGVLLGGATKGGVFAFLWPIFRGPGRQSKESIIWLKFVLETRQSSETLEHLVGFVKYLESELWQKNKNWSKFLHPQRKPSLNNIHVVYSHNLPPE